MAPPMCCGCRAERADDGLEDLWVDPGARGAGVGRRLIDALIVRGRERGWCRLYWHTEADNTAARTLYDRIVPVTGYVRYDVALQ